VSENNDLGVQTVLENMETIVASEGGTLQFLSLDDGSLSVKYIKGVNEECPECVPDHAMVKMMMENSLSIYAPHVLTVDLK
jgi:Fe-S cluster biogenesis protein NfuA|tara:strand:- start:540 stop:782 length:243 start_codon:yes stop_codon:yes gene_type:complete